MYNLEINSDTDKKFKKLMKKDKETLQAINKKINEIIENPHQYKPLKNTLKGTRRVHIRKSFVLLFKINEKSKTIIIDDFKHHDNAYK